MLQIEHITKQYKTGDFVQHALDDVSLTLRDNEFVAILGPSGSGKTTLLNIIGGLDRYDSGDLIINGTSTTKYRDRDWDSYRNHTIGFVFQSYNLIPHQSILTNVELALTISGISKKVRKRRARRALEQVGLGEHIHKKPNQLSGGQMQRVAIARALVNDPDIVLADEPTGALDTATSVQIMQLLKEVAKDRLVVMVTHNPELAQEYATRIVNLKDGHILGDSNPYHIEEAEQVAPVHRTMGKASMSLSTSIALSFTNLRTKKARTILTSFAGSIGIIGIALILAISTGVNTYIVNLQRETMTSYPITIDAQSWDLQSLIENSARRGEKKDPGHKLDKVYADSTAFTQASSITNSIAHNNLTKFKEYIDKKNSPIRQYVGDNGVHYSYDMRFQVVSKDPDDKLVTANGVTFGQSAKGMTSQMVMASGSRTTMSDITAMQMGELTGNKKQNAAPSSFEQLMPGHGKDELVSPVITDNYEVVTGAWPKNAHQVVLIADSNNEVPMDVLYGIGLLPSSEYQKIMDTIADGKKVDIKTTGLNYKDVLGHTMKLITASDQYVQADNGRYIYVGDDEQEMSRIADSQSAEQLEIVGVIKPKADAQTTMLTGSVGYTSALTDEIIDHTDSSAPVKAQEASRDVSVVTGLTFSPSDDATKIADARQYVAGLGVSEKANMAKGLMTAAAASGNAASGANGAAGANAASAANGATGANAGAGTQGAMPALSESQIAAQFDTYLKTADDQVLLQIYDRYVSTGTYDDTLADFGVVDRNAPSEIRIYTDSFEDKDKVSDAIKAYNDKASEKDRIVYVDYVGALMSSVTTIVNVITYVLIAFVSVSLIVSSIMIGIITYISVLERTKEIGILRAMGASKRNIAQVFNAETGMIGLCAGLIGVGVTWLLLIPGNALLHSLMGNTEVNAILNPLPALILVVLSVVLTLIGGIIPAGQASRKDPATALRTE